MWIEFGPVRQVDIQGFLGDVESHLPANHPYRDDDKVTWAHEGTHGINSAIRNQQPARTNAAYVLDNQAFVATEPNLTLAQVAKAVPPEIRGDVYDLYLIQQQRYWNEQPLYIFDELSAYINGLRVANDIGADDVRVRSTLDNAIEFLGYGGVLYSLCKHRELIDMLLFANIQVREPLSRVPSLQDTYDLVQAYLPLAARMY